MRTIRAEFAGVDLRTNLDGSDGMPVIFSESLNTRALVLEISADSSFFVRRLRQNRQSMGFLVREFIFFDVPSVLSI